MLGSNCHSLRHVESYLEIYLTLFLFLSDAPQKMFRSQSRGSSPQNPKVNTSTWRDVSAMLRFHWLSSRRRRCDWRVISGSSLCWMQTWTVFGQTAPDPPISDRETNRSRGPTFRALSSAALRLIGRILKRCQQNGWQHQNPNDDTPEATITSQEEQYLEVCVCVGWMESVAMRASYCSG